MNAPTCICVGPGARNLGCKVHGGEAPLYLDPTTGHRRFIVSASAGAGVPPDVEPARLRIMEVVDAEMKRLSKDGRDALRSTLVTALDAERGE